MPIKALFMVLVCGTSPWLAQLGCHFQSDHPGW